MEVIIAAAISAMATVLVAGGGFWGYLRTRDDLRKNNAKILMGLAHDKISSLGMCYIERGWITKDEYEDLFRYLYEPYVALGGNGTAERIMRAVQRLPLTEHHAIQVSIRRTDPSADPEGIDAVPHVYNGEERREPGS